MLRPGRPDAERAALATRFLFRNHGDTLRFLAGRHPHRDHAHGLMRT